MRRRRRPSVDDLHRRLDVLDAETGGPLTAAERAELAELQAEFDAAFPGVADDPLAVRRLSDAQLEDFIEYERGRDGKAQRLEELTRRARSPAETERDEVRGEMIRTMTDAELEAWLNARIHGPTGVPSWNR